MGRGACVCVVCVGGGGYVCVFPFVCACIVKDGGKGEEVHL